jgi:tubulin polyglutamylase TTLL4
MNRLRIKYPEAYSIMPMSYILPAEYDQFQTDRSLPEN